VVRKGWGQGGEMNQALYAHMDNKRKIKKKFTPKIKKKKCQYKKNYNSPLTSLLHYIWSTDF
jgi:hypothetical protein